MLLIVKNQKKYSYEITLNAIGMVSNLCLSAYGCDAIVRLQRGIMSIFVKNLIDYHDNWKLLIANKRVHEFQDEQIYSDRDGEIHTATAKTELSNKVELILAMLSAVNGLCTSYHNNGYYFDNSLSRDSREREENCNLLEILMNFIETMNF